jgi:predicted ATP-dependent Lon-type protease
MLPPKEHPRWREIVTRNGDISLHALATKMVMTRVKTVIGKEPSEDKVQEAITIAYDFFKKNEFAVADDIELLFGKETGT